METFSYDDEIIIGGAIHIIAELLVARKLRDKLILKSVEYYAKKKLRERESTERDQAQRSAAHSSAEQSSAEYSRAENGCVYLIELRFVVVRALPRGLLFEGD